MEKLLKAYCTEVNSKAAGKGPATDKAVHTLEALLLFMCRESDEFYNVDDGDRFTDLMRCIGAAYHHLAVTLEEKGRFNTTGGSLHIRLGILFSG